MTVTCTHLRPLARHCAARRKSRQIHVGRVPVGGDAPITKVQSMTNTLGHRRR